MKRAVVEETRWQDEGRGSEGVTHIYINIFATIMKIISFSLLR